MSDEYILMIKSSGLGDSEPDLGATLMKSFLTQVWESGKLPTKIFFLASGIFLTTQGSPVGDIISNFAGRGVEIWSCSTCLDYYGRKEKLVAGKPTTMKEIVGALLSSTRVVYA